MYHMYIKKNKFMLISQILVQYNNRAHSSFYPLFITYFSDSKKHDSHFL